MVIILAKDPLALWRHVVTLRDLLLVFNAQLLLSFQLLLLLGFIQTEKLLSNRIGSVVTLNHFIVVNDIFTLVAAKSTARMMSMMLRILTVFRGLLLFFQQPD